MLSNPIPIRLVEWNVAMSLHSKARLLPELNPTVAVLPETAHPDKTRRALEAIGATSVQWIGGNLNKGLSVVAFDGWHLRIDDSYDPGYQWVMPVHLTGPGHLRILAVWDMNHRGSGHQSARQLGACRASIPHYNEFLSGEADLALISGDFNNSVYWDKPTKEVKFGDFMDQLESRGFVSVYHSQRGCRRGAEPDPTLWWLKNIDTTYHIDYTFVSRHEAIEGVTIGSPEDWLAHSDHSPMTVDLRVMPRRELPTNPATEAGHHSIRTRTDDSWPHEPSHSARRAVATKFARFPIEPGTLPDMPCGVNGEPFVQVFRPTYFTAEWSGDVLVEVRIWGPRVLQDGSLGKRELDHRWKAPLAAGGIDSADLPLAVADRLRPSITENRPVERPGR